MNYRYYSLPRYGRSSSLDRVNYNSTTGRKAFNLSRDLMDNYQNARRSSELADTMVLNRFTRALSTSPGHISSKEHVPVHHFLARHRGRAYSPLNEDTPLPTSTLKAHIPPKYDYILDTPMLYNNNILSNLNSSDDYFYSKYYPRSHLNSWYPKPAYFYNQSYPKHRELYPLSRIPESSYFYRYRVLPRYDYNANDMLRTRRRRLETHNIYRDDFPEPPIGTFSNMRQSLNNVLDKIDRHKLLLDRYAGIDLSPNSSNVGNNILEKSMQMTSYRQRY